MRKLLINAYTSEELESIYDSINLAISSIKKCKEDKGITCLTCDKRQAIHYMKQVKAILKGKTYMNQ